jgi:hypothetical protein
MSDRRSAPALARTLDLIAVLLAALAAIVAVSGGFRAHAGGLRLAVTSPCRCFSGASRSPWCGISRRSSSHYRRVASPDRHQVAHPGDKLRGRRGHRHAADRSWWGISRCS